MLTELLRNWVQSTSILLLLPLMELPALLWDNSEASKVAVAEFSIRNTVPKRPARTLNLKTLLITVATDDFMLITLLNESLAMLLRKVLFVTNRMLPECCLIISPKESATILFVKLEQETKPVELSMLMMAVSYTHLTLPTKA